MIAKKFNTRSDVQMCEARRIREVAVQSALHLLEGRGASAEDIVRAASVIAVYLTNGTVPPVNAAAK